MVWSLWYLPVVVLVWFAGVIACRLYFHPLSNVPGPKIAAVTHLYKTYFNATNGSKFYIQIVKLHEEFGQKEIHFVLETVLTHCRASGKNQPG
jgi:hypothetical protein